MKNLKNIHYLIATVFCLGFTPGMPGTVGSLAGLGLVLLLHAYMPVYIGAFIALFAIGVISSTYVQREFAKKDPQIVVIDEFCAMFLVYLFIPLNLFSAIAGFVLFRFFDIVKIPPTKEIEKLPLGWGIMLDDIFAAVLANLVLQVLKVTPFV